MTPTAITSRPVIRVRAASAPKSPKASHFPRQAYQQAPVVASKNKPSVITRPEKKEKGNRDMYSSASRATRPL